MQDFQLWFQTGIEHILDFAGYDHICYVVALAIIYHFRTWRPLLIQITAFTIGHSLSLAASVLNIVKIPQTIIEIIIPITIIITCVINLIHTIPYGTFARNANFGLALCFGLIHGLGFSYLLKSMLGSAENITAPLLAFNIGLEVGQILIVSVVLCLSFMIEKSKIIKLSLWIQATSCLVLLIALRLLVERL
jgi:HupE / UreJ protein